MIDGTRPFRGKNTTNSLSNENASISESAPEAAPMNASHDAAATLPSAPDAVNKEQKIPGHMDRRAWFSALVPALGDGLVKILRVSNHLQDELKQASSDSTR